MPRTASSPLLSSFRRKADNKEDKGFFPSLKAGNTGYAGFQAYPFYIQEKPGICRACWNQRIRTEI
jgi:hypothetical protein